MKADLTRRFLVLLLALCAAAPVCKRSESESRLAVHKHAMWACDVAAGALKLPRLPGFTGYVAMVPEDACYDRAGADLCDASGGFTSAFWDCMSNVRLGCQVAVEKLGADGACPLDRSLLKKRTLTCQETLEHGARAHPPYRPTCKCCSEVPEQERQRDTFWKERTGCCE